VSTLRARPRLSRLVMGAGLGLIGALAVLVAAAVLSPWPSALAIRALFARGGRATNAALMARVPGTVTRTPDIVYSPGDPDALLDVYVPTATVGTAALLPTVVWMHGGGFVGGSKDELVGYLTILAAEGCIVVSVDYTRAPEATYPTPVRQVMAALAYVAEHAEELHVDLDQVVLAGDSAGAQLAAQTANILVDPAYAAAVGIEPTLAAAGVVGTVLYCGAYDLSLSQGSSRAGAWFVATVLRAYAGTRRWRDDDTFGHVSLVEHVTSRFPPSFVSAGNGDPLLRHSQSLAARLRDAGVAVDTLFFDADRSPALPHEYQFDLATEAGALSYARMTAFLRARTSLQR